MVDILHDTLFFLVDADDSFGMFRLLKLLAEIFVVSAHVFVFASIPVEFNTAIRNIRYRRTFYTKVYAHDVAVIRKRRFRNRIYDLGNNLMALYTIRIVPGFAFANTTFCLSVIDVRIAMRFDLPFIRTGNSI